MIVSFKCESTQFIFDGEDTKATRRLLPQQLHSNATKKMEVLNASVSLRSVGKVPANRLEKLEGDRRGQHSIRINDQYRICFRWTAEGPADVEITDYH